MNKLARLVIGLVLVNLVVSSNIVLAKNLCAKQETTDKYW